MSVCVGTMYVCISPYKFISKIHYRDQSDYKCHSYNECRWYTLIITHFYFCEKERILALSFVCFFFFINSISFEVLFVVPDWKKKKIKSNWEKKKLNNSECCAFVLITTINNK